MNAFRNKLDKPRRAVIYCRVSSKKQKTEGSGLSSQEYRCQQYADAKGYIVDKVFPDDVTGGGNFIKRKGMVALLQYLEDRPSEQYIVIFDDLKRYARDVEFHLALRRAMEDRKAIRECLNFNFEDTPEGKFNEIISAAAGQLEREQMARQNRQKSIARLEQGYAIFRPPIGYKYVKSPHGGKELVPDEPLASVVREGLEGFASSRFASQAEVKRFFEACPFFPKKLLDGTIRKQIIPDLLPRITYAGYVGCDVWGVPMRKGRHEPLISFETHQKIIRKLSAGVYAPARHDIHDDFPLRGAVSCDCCNIPLTAGWSKGRQQKYAYYRFRSGCTHYGKSVAREKIETEFEQLLSNIQPTQELADMAALMFRNCWNMLAEQASELKGVIKQKITDNEKKINQLVDRAVLATNPRVIAAYENNIEALEKEKFELVEKLQNPGRNGHTFEKLFEHALRFLVSPCKLWETERLDLRKIVLRLVFSDHLHYCPEKGFLNTNLSMPFKVLGGYSPLRGQDGGRYLD